MLVQKLDRVQRFLPWH